MQAVYKKDIGNAISWTTAQEFNCDYFELQRSVDGADFAIIATLRGQGNSALRHDYLYNDKAFNNGKNYYRFKQVDFNGRFTYSNMVMVDNTEEVKYSFELFPNPVKNILNIKLQDGHKMAVAQIHNAYGQLVTSLALQQEIRSTVDVSGYSNGVYFVTIISGDNTETKSFVKY